MVEFGALVDVSELMLEGVMAGDPSRGSVGASCGSWRDNGSRYPSWRCQGGHAHCRRGGGLKEVKNGMEVGQIESVRADEVIGIGNLLVGVMEGIAGQQH